MAVRTTAGSTLAVSAVYPATQDAAGYNALTYITVGEITDLGSGIGKKYNVVNHSPVGNRKLIKIKGSYNNGTMALKMGRDATDAGQAALLTARDSDLYYSIKITFQDGTKNYFQALVTEFTVSLSTVDTITERAVSLEIVTDIVEV